VRNVVALLAFHDERAVRSWLYHGFVLCEPSRFPALTEELINARKGAHCRLDVRIHFSQLRSSSAGSTQTATAVKWAELFVKRLYGSMWFYLFGTNLNNIDYRLFGSSSDGQSRYSKIYNRFFEIGLFAACRYFFDPAIEDVEILQIFSEKRELEKKDPFLTHAPYRINIRETNVAVKSREVIHVASTISREKDRPECVNMVNFVDVLVGGFSQVIDFTSASRGCTEVADKLYPVCRRLSENPFNRNSRYYKRYAMSFFPRIKQSKPEIVSYGARPPEEQFYSRRALRLYQPKCMPGFEKFAR